jgi:hypothetical protein
MRIRLRVAVEARQTRTTMGDAEGNVGVGSFSGNDNLGSCLEFSRGSHRGVSLSRVYCVVVKRSAVGHGPSSSSWVNSVLRSRLRVWRVEVSIYLRLLPWRDDADLSLWQHRISGKTLYTSPRSGTTRREAARREHVIRHAEGEDWRYPLS